MSEAANLQVLTFCLHQDIFGVRIDRVQEVVELSHVTNLPRTPAFVRGLLNVRGHVIPVIDLRRKLGLGSTPDTRGLAQQDDDLVMLLDFDTLFAGDDLRLPEGADSLANLMQDECPPVESTATV